METVGYGKGVNFHTLLRILRAGVVVSERNLGSEEPCTSHPRMDSRVPVGRSV